jgi:general secretion pathway protein A
MYTEFYRLSGLPFQLTPDPRFFFQSQSHHRALAYLTYGLQRAEGFVVITGDPGTGKTILIDRLLSTVSGERYRISRIVTSQLEPGDVLGMVASGFGLDPGPDRKSTTIRRLEEFLSDARRRGLLPLIIVDEVQNLPLASIEELRMLSNYQLDGTPLVQTLLVGQTPFRQSLADGSLAQLQQRVVASHHLLPLSAAETRAYIEHRLRQVGWAGDPALAEDAFPLIHAETGGVPRRINLVCDRVLLLGYVEERHGIDGGLIEQVVAEMRDEALLPLGAPPDRERPEWRRAQ